MRMQLIDMQTLIIIRLIIIYMIIVINILKLKLFFKCHVQRFNKHENIKSLKLNCLHLPNNMEKNIHNKKLFSQSLIIRVLAAPITWTI